MSSYAGKVCKSLSFELHLKISKESTPLGLTAYMWKAGNIRKIDTIHMYIYHVQRWDSLVP